MLTSDVCVVLHSSSVLLDVVLFLLKGQRFDPATFLWRLLLTCGDVEPNPGPVKCCVCLRSCTGRGPQCGRCGGLSHLGCSGLARSEFYALEGSGKGGWIGRCCEGEASGAGGAGSVRVCGVCAVRLRCGQEGVVCVGCGVRVHGKCCGGSGWRRRVRTE